MHALSRRTALVGLLGTAGVAVAGCADQPAPSVPPTQDVPPGTPSPSPSVDTRARWPLSGKLLKNPADAKHPAVAVKVPDNRNEHPQRGLDAADIVFVELDGYRDTAGYSGTRLVPVFHSTMPDAVGPVRSIRPVDIPLLSPIHALIGNTGATGWVLNYVQKYGNYLDGMLSYMNTRGTGAYSIDSSRIRVLNGVRYYDRAVLCHPTALAKLAKKFHDGPQEIYFPFGDAGAASTVDGKTARTISVPWKSGNSYNMGYTWNESSGTWLRSMPWGPHTLTGGKRVAPVNVLIIRAKQHYAKIYSGTGHDEPIHDIIDTSGPFHYFYGGKYVTGTWKKGDVAETFSFTLDDGSPLVMAPGQTYVELPNSTAKIGIKN
ncbi:MAG: DUF3048 domain-containing protein [Micropruina sp.]|uniref:DUF3048 domain-containing protein n=1 Tax=Micropruina sp. TaxID=2737536 RepID=UPI0039E646C0